MKFRQFVREKIFKSYSLYYESERKELFRRYLSPNPHDKILDFGGYDGRRMVELFSDKRKDIYIADISKEGLEIAKTKYEFETILLDESGTIPFNDEFFDIVFCNSVIEHVTVNKNEIYEIKTNKEFRDKSVLRQRKLANEIMRVGRKYFVQTPNKHFIIESHMWLPSIYIYLPRQLQIKIIKFFNKFWFQKCTPDFNLLTINDMMILFPEANVFKEKSFFMTKSIIVYN